jgi:hypothetical protein
VAQHHWRAGSAPPRRVAHEGSDRPTASGVRNGCRITPSKRDRRARSWGRPRAGVAAAGRRDAGEAQLGNFPADRRT